MGILYVVPIIETIRKKQNVTEGWIIAACYVLESIIKEIDQDTNLSLLSNYFYFLSDIDHKLKSSPMQCKW